MGSRGVFKIRKRCLRVVGDCKYEERESTETRFSNFLSVILVLLQLEQKNSD